MLVAFFYLELNEMETFTKLKQAKFFLGRQWIGISSTHASKGCLLTDLARTNHAVRARKSRHGFWVWPGSRLHHLF